MKRKTSLIISILLVFAVSASIRPTSAGFPSGQHWNGTGSALIMRANGDMGQGQADISVNETLTAMFPGHTDHYYKIVWVYDVMSLQWGAIWTIVQTKTLPNGNIMFHAVPLSVDKHGYTIPYLDPGPCAVDIVVHPRVTTPASPNFGKSFVYLTPQYALSLNVAYASGWLTPFPII